MRQLEFEEEGPILSSESLAVTAKLSGTLCYYYRLKSLHVSPLRFCLLLLHSFCLSPILFIFLLCMPASLAFSSFFSSSSVLHPSPSTKSSSHLWLYPLDDKIKAFSYFQGQTFFSFNVESTTGLHSHFPAVCLAQFRNACQECSIHSGCPVYAPCSANINPLGKVSICFGRTHVMHPGPQCLFSMEALTCSFWQTLDSVTNCSTLF